MNSSPPALEARARAVFRKFFFQNILAKGLGGSEENHLAILEKVLDIVKTQGRVPFAFSEMNESTNEVFKKALEPLGYIGWFKSKGEWAPSPTKKDPDGVALFLPKEMNDQVKVITPEMIPVEFVEKGKKTKVPPAPIIIILFPDGTYVVITHLKSKSDMTRVRLAQLQAHGVILEDESVDPKCVGLIGDLNEGLQMELREDLPGETVFAPKPPNPEEKTLVIQALGKSGMLPPFDHHPPTNGKEAKTLQGERYSGDTREAGANGVAFSITDVMAFRCATIKVTTATVPPTWNGWMATYHSDHAMLCAEIA